MRRWVAWFGSDAETVLGGRVGLWALTSSPRDWYNLEKSKRVKAFRCGEYNGCIERAKASAANSCKKAVKYARREDAILHALEIESTRLGKDNPDYFSRKDNSSCDKGSSARESPTMSHSGEENEDMYDEMSGSEDASDSAPELPQSGISFEEPNHLNGTKGCSKLIKRRKTPNDSEDDGSQRIKRMKGLEDLGMGVGSKRKSQAAGSLELVQHDNASFYGPNTGSCLSNRGPINGSRSHSSSVKRKRSQVENIHEFLKRKNRRRPLTKVLESTAIVSVPVVCDELPSPSCSPLGDFLTARFQELVHAKLHLLEFHVRMVSQMLLNVLPMLVLIVMHLLLIIRQKKMKFPAYQS
ncbi:uncharacterized protein At1g51745-like isoform X2 [Hibiscus syriacus]|uniref:uncharacterized protein At1g51745-like isoform X2 n=1 Tax=Hibiscus syriacus TaxID=106335 RepID=UPI001920FBBE|nr:uncharacterized protein At1g51745-like isoform X2 [Hibiscus syriacus]XP_039049730.1 uncharacterized protein At1g51745-like isoform X2 [Hibiscus syriacus]